VERGLSRKEVPFLMGATFLFTALVWDGRLGHLDAGLLVAGFLAFMWWTIKNRDRGAVVTEVPARLPDIDPGHRGREVAVGAGMTLLGIGGLAAGGHFIVSSALWLAMRMGISETLIGLTLVAVGTSLPELATTIVAALRNEDDLALGNIVGSNLFNILAVAGPVGLFWNLDAEGAQGGTPWFPLQLSPLQIQMVSMMALTVMVFTMIIFGRGKIGRRRGLSLLLTYILIMFLWAQLN
jgi:cation:H+ antiporter